jgi:hypothetical protein
VALVPSSSRGGGGGTPAGSDGEIQFNDDDAFGADPDFVWASETGNGRLKLGSTANENVQIMGNAAGVQLGLSGADGDASHVGGEVTIVGGDSAGQGGGGVFITGGADSDGGAGGGITIQAGASPDGDGGELQLKAGDGDAAGRVVIQGGATDGYVRLDGGAGGLIDVTPDGIFLDLFGTGKIGAFGATPVTKETGVAVTAAAIHAALVRLGWFAA